MMSDLDLAIERLRERPRRDPQRFGDVIAAKPSAWLLRRLCELRERSRSRRKTTDRMEVPSPCQ